MRGGETFSPTPSRGGVGGENISPTSSSQCDARVESQVSTEVASERNGRTGSGASFRNSSRFVSHFAAGGPVSQRASRSSLQYQVSCEDNSGLDDSLVTALEDQDDILLLCEYSPLPYDSAVSMNYKGKDLR